MSTVKQWETNKEALKSSTEILRLVSTRCFVYLQHPSRDHPPHKRLNIFLDAFEIRILGQKPLLYGQQALQDSVIAQEVWIGTSSYDGVHFEAEQLHGAGALSQKVGNHSRERKSGVKEQKYVKRWQGKCFRGIKVRLQGSVRVVLPLLVENFFLSPHRAPLTFIRLQIRQISSLPYMRADAVHLITSV